ncbi:MAG: bifunctional DNA-formamidopyrimidine glycosylase/DNA-(apurinic or apyrimidinic site) lyase [Gemmatimonadales bacterium]
MPELPEVETIVRGIRPLLVGRTLSHPKLHHRDVLRRVSAARLLRTLDGSRVDRVERRAKHAVILLGSGHRLVIQPRMTGSLLVYDRRLSPQERRYVVLEAGLGRGSRFVYRDVRRLGTIWLLDERGWRSYTARVGPEPLDPAFDAAAFGARLAGSRQAVKKVLMDQRRIAGIGNIYANEALFDAGIDPSRRADRLAADEMNMLHAAVRSILSAAVDRQGTTVRDYRTGTGQAGSYQEVLQVYGREGEPCPRCGARLVTTHAIDQRQTTFCWRCQR